MPVATKSKRPTKKITEDYIGKSTFDFRGDYILHRFDKLEEKVDSTRIYLEKKVDSTRIYLENKIDSHFKWLLGVMFTILLFILSGFISLFVFIANKG